jgi:hypothetical protein
MTAALRRLVRARIDPRPLAAARIALAAAALLKSADLALAMPELAAAGARRLPYPWSPLPALGPALAWGLPAAAALAALALALGWHSRASAALLAAVLGVALAADRQLYSNHLWLLFCLLALLAVTDCGAACALDARRRGGPVRAVPAGPARLLQTQLTAVYAFAALAKLNPDFLSGSVLATHLHAVGPLALPAALRAAGPLAALAVASVALEAFLAVGLWLRRLRPAAFALGVGLHLAIVLWMEPALPLAVFGLASVAVYPLYAAPSLPAAD